MKYCSKCGTPMSDDATVCPQCHPETKNQPSNNSNQPNSPQRKFNKTNLLIVINIILTTVLLITFIATYFIPSLNNDSPSKLNSTPNKSSYTSNCPKDKYGNHDWSTPTCVSPAYCYECGEYRDDKLGQHNFWTTSDGFNECMDCGILYEVYIDSLNGQG